MALTEKTIREKILATIWEAEPYAKHIRDNPLIGKSMEWAGKFAHEVEIEGVLQDAVYGWVVRRIGYKPVTPTNPIEQYIFELLGFRQLDAFADGGSGEDEWQETLEKLAQRFADNDVENPVWEFEPLENGEDEEDEAITNDIDFASIGLVQSSQILRFGGGRLVVNIYRC